MKAMFEALLTIVIGLALLPVVREFVGAGKTNASASEIVILGLVTFFWVLAVVGIAAGLVYRSYKSGK